MIGLWARAAFRSAAARPGRNLRLPAAVLPMALAAAGLVLLAIGHVPLLRAAGTFLVVDQPLEPAAAIVALAGQSPERETEAAALDDAGWAPSVVIVAGTESGGLQVGARRQVLMQLGVPQAAIVTVEDPAQNTRQELGLAARAVRSDDGALILVTSRYHARRVLLTWDRVIGGERRAIVRTAPLDSFDPDRWWQDARMRALVVHEYLGMLQLVGSWPR